MAKQHAERFLKIVSQVKESVRECTIHEVKTRQDTGEEFYLIDVREEREWAAGRLPNAIHLGKGVIERDIEKTISDVDAPIVLYCGGGYRSALAAHNLMQMGYQNVISMDGGYRGWSEAGFEIIQDA